MPVSTVITDLSTTAASNFPSGSDSPSVLDDQTRALGAFIAQIRDGTVAVKVGAVTPTTGAFTTLSTTGNVTVTGNLGLGGVPGTNTKIYIRATGAEVTGATSGYGFYADVPFDAGVTLNAEAFRGRVNSSGVLTDAIAFRSMDAVEVAGSITNNYGFYAGAMSVGTNNYAFYASNAAAAGRWNFYADGSAPNYFAGNVGVGVTPSAWTIKALQVGAASLSNTSADFYSSTNAFYDGAWKYISTAAASQYYQLNGAHVWRSTPSGTSGTAITWTNVLAVEKDKTLALQGATSGTGAGLSFPATQVASADANTIDDYEEGTFTAVVRDAAAGNAATVGTNECHYQKVGNRVHYSIALTNITTAGMTAGNQIFITGLPFTHVTVTNFWETGAVYVSSTTTTTGGLTLLIPSGQSYMQLYNQSLTSPTSALVSQMTSTTADLYITGSYEAA